MQNSNAGLIPYTAQPFPEVHPHHYHESIHSNLHSSQHNTHQLHSSSHFPSYGAIHRLKPEDITDDTCPLCGVGVLENDWTCLGVLCAMLFFPLIILCCIQFNEKKCSNCGATFR